VPGAGHDGELLSRRKRALLTVEDERDPPRPELYMLDKVVLHVLAARGQSRPLRTCATASADVSGRLTTRRVRASPSS
jgi:hypothetical protein